MSTVAIVFPVSVSLRGATAADEQAPIGFIQSHRKIGSGTFQSKLVILWSPRTQQTDNLGCHKDQILDSEGRDLIADVPSVPLHPFRSDQRCAPNPAETRKGLRTELPFGPYDLEILYVDVDRWKAVIRPPVSRPQEVPRRNGNDVRQRTNFRRVCLRQSMSESALLPQTRRTDWFAFARS